MLHTLSVRRLAAVATLHGALVVSASALAQEPCCAVSAIDLTNATVTARERGGQGRTMQFKVLNPAILRTLKVGQAVFADEAFERVAFTPGGYACCELIDEPAQAETSASR